MIFGPVDIVVRRAIDDHLRPDAIDRRRDGRIVGQVGVAPGQRHGVVRRSEVLDHRGAELAARAGHDDAHQAAAFSKARICESSNTPSQRATTAVAMQLPITFTDVRPMSRI